MHKEEDGEVILRVDDLVVDFVTPDGIGRAVDGLSYYVSSGETLGIVGESGCGKSISALSILQLVPSPPGHVRRGKAMFNGVDLLKQSDREIRALRGQEISMIFQEPMTSLNPVLTVGYQIAEAVSRHMGQSKKLARARAVEMLELVRIPEPDRRARQYPHQLSGGMRQRAMIAMALSCNPKVLIADEPTTALDVTIQAQVLELISDLQSELGTALILITHDLAVVAETCDRVIVMYAGRKIEEAGVEELFAAPTHPYTQGLLAAVPRLTTIGTTSGTTINTRRQLRLNEIPGVVPPITQQRQGCLFAARCERADDRCRAVLPEFADVGKGHRVACWHASDQP